MKNTVIVFLLLAATNIFSQVQPIITSTVSVSTNPNTITLPFYQIRDGKPYGDILREIGREFPISQNDNIDPRVLSGLFYAANGFVRQGENIHAAFSLNNLQNVDIYVLNKDGIYLYNDAKHQLDLKKRGDFRSQIVNGLENFPLILVYATKSKTEESSKENNQPQQQVIRGYVPATENAAGANLVKIETPVSSDLQTEETKTVSFDSPKTDMPVNDKKKKKKKKEKKNSKSKEIDTNDFRYAMIQSGAICQNVILYCNFANLLTSTTEKISEDIFKETIEKEDIRVLFAQPIGNRK